MADMSIKQSGENLLMARWEVTFWCKTCSRDINFRVYSDEPLADPDKKRFLEDGKHKHSGENHHLSCFKCGNSIKRHEIASGVWDGKTMNEICRDCAEAIYGTVP